MPKVRFPALFAVAVFAAACGGSDSTKPEVTSVTVSPASATLDFLGGSVQFSAQVKDQDGNTMSGVTVVWSSSDPSVATVDASGLATGLAAGSVQIRANAGTVFGESALTISPADCFESLDLAAGAFRVLPATCAFTLPAGSAGDRYRVAVLNQNAAGTASSVTDVTLNVATVAAASATVSGLPVASTAAADLRQGFDLLELSPRDRRNLWLADGIERRTREVHLGLRAAEAALMDALGTEAVLPDRAASLVEGAQVADLPARLELRPNPGTTCSATGTPKRPALLVGQNDFLAVYQDSALNVDPATEVTAAQAQQILDYYGSYGKATIDAYFPGMPDVDANGKIIMYVSFDEALAGGATGAYVWGGDLLTTSQCEASNQAELTYFNAALIRELDQGFDQALETMVHEAKHISSFWQGIARSRIANSSQYQPSWLEEGSAEIAGNMSSRRAWAALGGPAANERVVAQDFRDIVADNGGSLPAEVFGVLLRMYRAQAYLSSQPNGLIVTPLGAGSDHSVYGSGWTFLRWLGDAYGNAAQAAYQDRTFFAAQNDSLTPPGTAGLQQITGKTFPTLLEEFALAAMFHSQPSQPSSGGYTSYDFVSAIEMWCFAVAPPEDPNNSCSSQNGPPGSFPWPVTTRSSDAVMYAPFAAATFTGRIGPTGIRVHEFRSDGTTSISLRATATQPAKVIVARVQ